LPRTVVWTKLPRSLKLLLNWWALTVTNCLLLLPPPR
jgi:hypothetical protein